MSCAHGAQVQALTSFRFLISTNAAGPAPDDDAAEGKSRPHEGSSVPEGDARDRRSSGPSRRMTKEQKKAQRGANKGRRFQKVRDELDLCYKVANGSTCEFGEGYVAALLSFLSISEFFVDAGLPMTSLRI